MKKIDISLSPEALGEFEDLIANTAFSGLAKRYLKELDDFPPEKWGDIHTKDGDSLFKSDNHVIFDIQGKVIRDSEGEIKAVKITRFRLRLKA